LFAPLSTTTGSVEIGGEVLRGAEVVAVTLPTLCEFVWVLKRGTEWRVAAIVNSDPRLIDSASVRADRPALMQARGVRGGGDFADGVIAFEGRRLGGSIFTSSITEPSN